MQLQGAKKVIFTYSLPFQQAVANNQLQKNLRHCTVFWHKWPVHYQFEWEGGVRSVLSHRPVTSNDLMKERFFLILQECLNIFATGCLSPSYLYSHGARLFTG